MLLFTNSPARMFCSNTTHASAFSLTKPASAGSRLTCGISKNKGRFAVAPVRELPAVQNFFETLSSKHVRWFRETSAVRILRLFAACLGIAFLFFGTPLFAAPQPTFGQVTI